MNRIYSLVWNRALRSVQVASELATSTGGGNAAAGTGSNAARRHPLALACAAALALGALALPAWSATCPAGAVVIAPPDLAGTAGVSGTTGTSNGNDGGAGGTAYGDTDGTHVCVNGAMVIGGDGGVGGSGAYGASGQNDVGSSGGAGGAGGAGVDGSNFALVNAAGSVIAGGTGGAGGTGSVPLGSVSLVPPLIGHAALDGGYGGAGGTGGAGVSGTQFSLENSANIDGGAGGVGGAGGAGGAGTTGYMADAFGGYGGIGRSGGSGGTGVSGNGFTVDITAQGSVVGGAGGDGGVGGRGGDAAAEPAGPGGAGVSGSSFTLTDAGSIRGGAGGIGGAAGANGTSPNGALIPVNQSRIPVAGGDGSGGAGVVSTGGGVVTVKSGGSITGGLSGDGVTRAVAVSFSGGSNSLTIESGAQVVGAVVSNSGGGSNGDILNLDAAAGSTLAFDLSAAPVSGFAQANTTDMGTVAFTGTGGAQDWVVQSGTLQVGAGASSGTVHGSVGAAGSQGGVYGFYTGVNINGGNGGNGETTVTLSAGAQLNVRQGSAVAGGGAGAGGDGGVEFFYGSPPTDGAGGNGGNGGLAVSSGAGGAAGAVSNDGSIYGAGGAAGGSSFNPTASGNGGKGGTAIQGSGVGAHLFAITNSGQIVGGNGGAGGNPSDRDSGRGQGGAGVAGSYLALDNDGSITGGSGSIGGAAVVSTGGSTVTNAGSIVGGSSVGGAQVDAVNFSGGASTLSLENGYSFTGNVVSTSGATNGGDTLALGGDVTGTGATGNGTFNVPGIVPTLPASPVAATTYYVGFNQFAKTGTSTWTLTGSTTAVTPWTIGAGTLSVSSDGNLGGVSGGVTINGGTLQAGGSFASSRPFTITNYGYIDTNGYNLSLGGSIQQGTAGNGQVYGVLFKQGAGTLTITGSGNSLDTAEVDVGTLALSGGGALNVTALNVASGAIFDISQTDNGASIATLGGNGTVALGAQTLSVNLPNSTWTYAGVLTDGGIAGGTGGSLVLDDSPATMTLTGLNTFTGSTTLEGGTLALYGAGSIADSSDLNLAAGTTFDTSATTNGASIQSVQGAGSINVGAQPLTVTNANPATTFDGGLAGSGSLSLTGGTLILDGNNNSFTGGTTVQAATLIVGDDSHATAALGGNVTVDNGATLGGNGSVGGAGTSVEVKQDGILAPGDSIGTLTVGGGLTLDSGSVLDYDLGAPASSNPLGTAGTSDHVSVAGALNFDGGSTLNLSGAGGMGLYNLASYGALATPTCSFSGGTACMTVGTLPSGAQASWFTLVNNTAGQQIDLYNSAGQTLSIWDPLHNASPFGGSGTWTATSATWTDTNGDGPSAMVPPSGSAIFQGAPGTVTVSNANGRVTVSGMQFAVDGYTLTGDPLTLVDDAAGNAPVIEVGDGSSNSANMIAALDNELDSSVGFTKTGGGTLVLNPPAYAFGGSPVNGTVAVQGGTLQLGTGETTEPVLGTALVMSSGTNLLLRNSVIENANNYSGAVVSGQNFNVTLQTTGSAGLSSIGSAFSVRGMTAVQGTSFTLTMSGNSYVAGGYGASGAGAAGAGGAGVTGTGFTVNNSSAGAGPGGYGNGIYGGAGGNTGTTGAGGAGGVAIGGSGFTVINSGNVFGGYGGSVYTGNTSLPGLGGAGISGSGFSLTNTGTVAGGMGGYVGSFTGSTGGVAGGAGVYSTGGATVINEGTISGGLTGTQPGDPPSTTYADAIDFTGGGNTLELVAGHPGTFNGAIVVTRAAGDAADTLALGGDTGSDTFDLSQLASGGIYGGFNAEAKSGTSTWTLTGAGSASENWTIEGGTLQGDATTFQGSIAFAPASGATASVVFDQTPDATYAGVVSGDGDFTKTGAGALTLTGANTWTGGTTISAGTLQVGNGGTSGALGTGAIIDNGALVFDRSDAVVLPAGLTGTGALIQQGSGMFTVNGDDSGFAGTTTIKAGTATVGDDSHAAASLGGMVTIAKGATLTGIGTISGMDLSGTLSPGGSIGTFHVTGDATFESGSTFNVEAAPDGTADQLAVGGKTTIKGGNTLVMAQPGNWAPSTTYTVITSGAGVTGTFSGVSDDQAFLTPTLAYGADDVTLTLARNNVNFGSVAQNPNQQGVAGGIEGIGFGNALYDAVVKLTADQARTAFDQTSGEYHASQQTARIDDSRYVREAMNQRLRAGDADAEAAKVGDTQLTAWAHAWGHWGTVDGDGNAAKLSDNGDGLLIGADMPVGTQARVGVTGGASRNSLSVNDRNSWGRETSTWLGAFAGYDAGALGLRGGIAYAWDRIPTNREVNFPGYTDRLSGNASGDTLTGFIEGSWTFHFANGSVSPFLNVAHTRVETDASTEAGGAAALHAFDATENVSFSTLGARGEINFAHNLNMHGELGWQHAFGDTTPEANLQFVAGGPAFTEYGVPIAKNAGLGRIGIGWHQGNVAVDADYEGLAGNGVKDQAAKVSVSVTF